MLETAKNPIEKVRQLQRRLGVCAKQSRTRRFHALYNRIHRSDVLWEAWKRVRSNKGAAGVDEVTLRSIEERGVTEFLEGIQAELKTGQYRPSAVKRRWIRKADGKQRPLGIPTIRDRVIQMAAKLVIEPIFEADFQPCSYGFRPKRSATQALEAIREAGNRGHNFVVDADIQGYFDGIDRSILMDLVKERISDRRVLKLIRQWLEAGVMEDGMVRETLAGTPQGGVIGPLLANLYMNRMLKGWRQTKRGEQFQARIVSYADDFVNLSRGKAAEALGWARGTLTRLGLTLNEAKTSIRNARQERFDFLGYTFGPHFSRRTGREYVGYSPSQKSVNRIKEKVGEHLKPGNVAPWEEVRDQLNQKLRGWKAYFGLGSPARAYEVLDEHVEERVRHFLRRRHKVQSQGTRQFSMKRIFGELGVFRFRGPPREARS